MSSPVAVVAGYMRKAERALDEARLLLQAEKTEGACSRAYYAMHDATHAALLATGHETPGAIIKTHHTLIAEFGKRLVLSGQIDAAPAARGDQPPRPGRGAGRDRAQLQRQS